MSLLLSLFDCILMVSLKATSNMAARYSEKNFGASKQPCFTTLLIDKYSRTESSMPRLPPYQASFSVEAFLYAVTTVFPVTFLEQKLNT